MDLKDCFVIMPFSTTASHTEDEWTAIFEELFKPAWTEFVVDCYRIKVPRGSITKSIIEKLYGASMVFADLTDSNPNVMYELGVRHTFRKPSIMVKEHNSTIPFDVSDYAIFEYEKTPEGLADLKDHIRAVIQNIEQFPNKCDNPVWDFLQVSEFIVDYHWNKETIRKLEAIKEELESNLEKCDGLLDELKNIKILGTPNYNPTDDVNRVRLERAMECFFPTIRSDAITHLKVTRYVNFPKDDWIAFDKIDNFYKWCQFFSSNLGTYELDEAEKEIIKKKRRLLREGLKIIDNRISELESK
ncbi:MAG: hypothetical protein JW878_02730 [Methanomicrobia archaeon]|nr:hypothetical protein [Methanomicrobia archaeon]